MSGYTAGVFTDQQQVDIRRYCGFPAKADGAVVFPMPFINQQYLALEYRLNTLSVSECAVVVTKLAALATLEAAIPAAGANLDTDQAAVWTHNKNEVKDRIGLYRTWRIDLCEFIGIKPGPGLQGGGSTVRVIV